MEVKLIVPNIAAERVEEGLRSYRDVLGPETVMDLGWIVTPVIGSRCECASEYSY